MWTFRQDHHIYRKQGRRARVKASRRANVRRQIRGN